MDFFGPLTRLVVEGEKAEMAVEFQRSAGLKQQSLVLASKYCSAVAAR